MSALSLGLVDHDPLVLYALQDLVQRSAEKIRLLWSVRSHRAALRRLASVRPAPDAILLSDDVADEAVLLVRAASERCSTPRWGASISIRPVRFYSSLLFWF